MRQVDNLKYSQIEQAPGMTVECVNNQNVLFIRLFKTEILR